MRFLPSAHKSCVIVITSRMRVCVCVYLCSFYGFPPLHTHASERALGVLRLAGCIIGCMWQVWMCTTPLAAAAARFNCVRHFMTSLCDQTSGLLSSLDALFPPPQYQLLRGFVSDLHSFLCPPGVGILLSKSQFFFQIRKLRVLLKLSFLFLVSFGL